MCKVRKKIAKKKKGKNKVEEIHGATETRSVGIAFKIDDI